MNALRTAAATLSDLALHGKHADLAEAALAVRAALAAPRGEQQPRRWLVGAPNEPQETHSVWSRRPQAHDMDAWPQNLREQAVITPLYASPQALPLTAEQRAALVMVLCHYQDDDRVACLHELLAARPQAEAVQPHAVQTVPRQERAAFLEWIATQLDENVGHVECGMQRAWAWSGWKQRALRAEAVQPSPAQAVPLPAMREIALEAIRNVTGASDIEGKDGLWLVDELVSAADAAANGLRGE